MATPISFLSDYGHHDEYVGVVHGVIARIAPEVKVVDVGHDFPAGQIRPAALALMRAVQYLPPGVALAIVDPGVGTSRRAICARTGWGYFIGPDNGLLAPAVAMVGGADKIVSIENPELRLPAEGVTFAGRDLFAPAAAVLASDQATIDELGPDISLDTVTPLMIPLVAAGPSDVLGEVLWVDHFGNAQTNIAPGDLTEIGLAPGDDVIVRVGAAEHRVPWVATYADVPAGQPLVHVDSYGQMAVAVHGGRADEELPLGDQVAVTMLRPSGGNRIHIQGMNPDV